MKGETNPLPPCPYCGTKGTVHTEQCATNFNTMNETKTCCHSSAPMGKCGRGLKKGCNGTHCKCMGGGCSEMHYVDCFEHYIHVENDSTPNNSLEANYLEVGPIIHCYKCGQDVKREEFVKHYDAHKTEGDSPDAPRDIPHHEGVRNNVFFSGGAVEVASDLEWKEPTKEWRERFDKEFISNVGYVLTGDAAAHPEKITAFIASEIEQAFARGKREATDYNLVQLAHDTGVKEGKAERDSELREVVEGMRKNKEAKIVYDAKELDLPGTRGYVAMYNQAITDVLTLLTHQDTCTPDCHVKDAMSLHTRECPNRPQAGWGSSMDK